MTRRGAWRPVLAMWGLAIVGPACADIWQPIDQWRIDSGSVAPWAAPGTKVDPAYRGREVRFLANRVAAPHPIACEGAKYQWIFLDARSLFEGNLPEPATTAARRLGMDTDRVATLRVGCANAGFDFHRTSEGDLLLGLDNVVWTLRASRSATTAEETVQEFLVQHFTHDMAFTKESIALKRLFFSADLRTRIAGWFAIPQSPNDVASINGDPFTDSQEYPDRFTLGVVRTGPERTTVPVIFTDERVTRRVDYVVVREGARWVLDDLLDERGLSLRRQLGATPASSRGSSSRK